MRTLLNAHNPFVYAQTAAERRSHHTAPLHIPLSKVSSRGTGAFSGSRRSSRPSSAVVCPQPPEWRGPSGAERAASARPRGSVLALQLDGSINSRASTEERRRQLAGVSALAEAAKRAEADLRDASAERQRLSELVARGEERLRMQHESAAVLESAMRSAVRRLDAADRAAEAAAQAEAVQRDADEADELGTAALRPPLELVEEAAQLLRQLGARVAAACRAGAGGEPRASFAALASSAQLESAAQLTCSAQPDSAAQLDGAARAVVLALAELEEAPEQSDARAAPRAPSKDGTASAAGQPDAPASPDSPSAPRPPSARGPPSPRGPPLYEASLAYAPWIRVDPFSWAVLVPAEAVGGGGGGSDGGSDGDGEAEGEGGAGARGAAPTAQGAADRALEPSAGPHAGGDNADADEEDGHGSVVAIPLEVLSRQHAAMGAQLAQMRGAAAELEAEVRSLVQAVQFEQIDADRDGLVSLRDAAPRAADWGIAPAVLERAFAGAVLQLRGGRGRMDASDFSRFVRWVEDGGQSRDGLRAWVRCLDVDGDGCVGHSDLLWWYKAIHSPPAAAGAPAAAARAPDRPGGAEGGAEGAPVVPFGSAPESQRAERHTDAGGADTPRREHGPGAGAPAAGHDAHAASGAEGAEGGPAGEEEAAGSCSFADLLCQLTDMACAGPPAQPSAHAAKLAGALTFAALHRSRLAPAILQLLLTPQPAASRDA